MKLRKLISVALAATMVLSMAACKPKAPKQEAAVDNQASSEASGDTAAPAAEYASDVTLKVWGSQEQQELLGRMIEEFKAAHTGTNWDIQLGVVGENDAKTKYLEDPAAAADVFCYANDQLRNLVSAGALYDVTRNVDDIKARNMPEAIEAVSLDGHLYGYPMTSDNGYFLYYDKSVISEEDAGSLDTILKKANEAGKKVFMDVSNGWYIASFFLGNGCTLTLDEKGNQVCDFNNEKGIEAGEAIKAFTADPAFVTGDDSVLAAGIGDSIVAVVSGTWKADSIQEALGDNYAATKLPTFTTASGQVQMGSFVGYKVVGVNSQTQFPVEAMDLADFITNEANQTLRFNEMQLLPSNTKAAEMAKSTDNIAIAALQAQHPFGTSQKDVLDTYWSPAEAFGATMEAKDYSKDIPTLLNDMVAQINAAAQ